jgi:putative membrane protein
MWNCNWGPPIFHSGIVGILINVMMLVTIIYIVVLIIRSFLSKGKTNKDTSDSLEIVKRKFALGEITEEEYHRMNDILTG